MSDLKNIKDNLDQNNDFVRQAKKKSSLKTNKTHSDIHTAIKGNLGTVKLKTLKWNNEQLEKLELEKRPLSNRKKLESSKSYYKAYVINILY